MSNVSIWPIDEILSGATSLESCGPGSDGNEGLLRIPQSSSINGASPSDYFVSYPGPSFGESYHYADRQSVYSTQYGNESLAYLKNLITIGLLETFKEQGKAMRAIAFGYHLTFWTFFW